MRAFAVEFAAAFGSAMMHGRNRVGRWAVVLLLWILAVGAWVFGAFTLAMGSVGGVAIVIDGFTFVIVSVSVIIAFSTSEARRIAQEARAWEQRS